MTEGIRRVLEGLSGNPFLQGVLAAASTFILEDPTTVGCGMLVADGKMGFWTAYLGLAFGIALGDIGLYLIGRWLGPRVEAWGLVDRKRMEAAHEWYDRNLLAAVLVSRCVPGTRVPAFMAAGVLRASPGRFVALVVAATLAWTLALLTVTVKVGERVLPYLGDLKWPFAIIVLAAIVLVHHRSMRRMKRFRQARLRRHSPVSLFELWPPVLFYFPVALHWIGLAVRYRGLTLPTAVNPSIYAGGLVGERQSEVLRLLPAEESALVAPFVTFTPAADQTLETRVHEAKGLLTAAGLEYTLVARPDRGLRGAGVRQIESDKGLTEYLRGFPAGEPLLLQRQCPGDHEAGLLWVRMPGDPRGRIISFTIKEFPSITGDGKRTLRELILDDDRARLFRETYFRRHAESLDAVPGAGQTYRLVDSGVHSQGAIFRNGNAHMTTTMEDAINRLGMSMPDFYFGRFDVRYRSLEEMQRGEGFQIVAIHGAGAEATHIWDADTRLRDAYRTLFEQYRILFRIGHQNRKKGTKPMPWMTVLRDFRVGRHLARRIPQS